MKREGSARLNILSQYMEAQGWEMKGITMLVEANAEGRQISAKI